MWLLLENLKRIRWAYYIPLERGPHVWDRLEVQKGTVREMDRFSFVADSGSSEMKFEEARSHTEGPSEPCFPFWGAHIRNEAQAVFREVGPSKLIDAWEIAEN